MNEYQCIFCGRKIERNTEKITSLLITANWENEKSYPDLLTLVKISDEFNCSLDAMLKENYAMTEDFNKKMKYGEESALLGGLSAIFLFISAIAMIVLKYGTPYVWVLFLFIAFSNSKEEIPATKRIV